MSICSADGQLQILFLCMETLVFLVFLKDRLLIRLAGIYWFILLCWAPDKARLHSIGTIKKKKVVTFLCGNKLCEERYVILKEFYVMLLPKYSAYSVTITYVMHTVPPTVLQLVHTFLCNYLIHISTHTHTYCIRLSFLPVCL